MELISAVYFWSKEIYIYIYIPGRRERKKKHLDSSVFLKIPTSLTGIFLFSLDYLFLYQLCFLFTMNF